MPVRLIVLAAVLCSLVAAAPAAAATQGNGGKRKGTVTINVAVKKFGVSQRQIVGRGELTARVQDNRGSSQTVRRPVRFAFSAQRGNCRILTLTLDDLQLELLGLKVDVSTVNLRLFGIPRGEGSGVLGRLFCSLARSSIRLRSSIRAAAHARKVVRSLNTRMKGRPMRAVGVRAALTPDAGSASSRAPAARCCGWWSGRST